MVSPLYSLGHFFTIASSTIEPRPAMEGVDFTLDSEDGSGDKILEFVPDSDDEGGGATSQASDIKFVPD